jgi:hypothetical protein
LEVLLGVLYPERDLLHKWVLAEAELGAERHLLPGQHKREGHPLDMVLVVVAEVQA